MNDSRSFVSTSKNRYCHAGRCGEIKVGDIITGFLFYHQRLFLRNWLSASQELVQTCFEMNDCRSFRNTSGPVPDSQTTSSEAKNLTSALSLPILSFALLLSLTLPLSPQVLFTTIYISGGVMTPREKQKKGYHFWGSFAGGGNGPPREYKIGCVA